MSASSQEINYALNAECCLFSFVWIIRSQKVLDHKVTNFLGHLKLSLCAIYIFPTMQKPRALCLRAGPIYLQSHNSAFLACTQYNLYPNLTKPILS